MKLAFLSIFILSCLLSFGQSKYNEGDRPYSIYDVKQADDIISNDLIVTIYNDTLQCNIEEITDKTVIYLADGLEEYIFLSEIDYYLIVKENGERVIVNPKL